MDGATRLRLIIGLGNPGSVYAATRHNMGFMVLDRFANIKGWRFERDSRCNAEIAREPSGKMLVKPLSFMNLSGQPVGELVRYYKILPEQILVVLDDLAIPFGTLRIRKKGSAGGHNGLASILSHLSTEAVPRLRLGIGTSDRSATGHVLSSFSKEEMPVTNLTISRACEAINVLDLAGIDAAMNQFN